MVTSTVGPGIYYIQPIPVGKTYTYALRYNSEKFPVPDKIYGDVRSKVIRIWNRYAIEHKTVGCLFTGIPGSGKSQMAKLLCNLALDNNIPVIMCVEIHFTLELINFLNGLQGCVLFFDEFKKNVDYRLEDKMLTMLTDPNDTKKLFILTENDSFSISSLIRNRPERIRYHYAFDKLSKDIYDEMCAEFKIEKQFKEDLDDLYKRIQFFSFDQLQSILTEHSNYPNDSLNDLLSTLNLHSLSKRKYLIIVESKLITKEEEKPVTVSLGKMYYSDQLGREDAYINLLVEVQQEPTPGKPLINRKLIQEQYTSLQIEDDLVTYDKLVSALNGRLIVVMKYEYEK